MLRGLAARTANRTRLGIRIVECAQIHCGVKSEVAGVRWLSRNGRRSIGAVWCGAAGPIGTSQKVAGARGSPGLGMRDGRDECDCQGEEKESSRSSGVHDVFLAVKPN